jgi:hypothetical protein
LEPLNQQRNNADTETGVKRSLILHTVLWFVVLAVLVVAQSTAQDTPDFSGDWILESVSQSAADIPKALSVRQSLVRTNVRGEPMTPFFKDITVARDLANGTRSETYQIGIAGGTVPGPRADGSADGPRTHHRVEWEERTLVIENGSYTGPTRESGQWTELREVWSLDPDGRLRLAITTRSSVGASSTVTLVYRRQ